MSREAAAVARRAAEIIQERGMHKGGLRNYETNRVCLMGAVFDAAREQECRDTVQPVLVGAATALHDLVDEWLTITDWNDRPETDERDVAKLLMQVADRLDIS